MKARLALIFGLLLAVIFPAVSSGTTSAGGEKAGAVAGAAVFVLLGIPTLICGHGARRTVAQFLSLKGGGRAAIGLFLGYVCLLLMVFVLANAFLPPGPSKQQVVQASPAPGANEHTKQTAPDTDPSADLGSVWNEQESGEWHGQWTRRGTTNVFDATIQKGTSAETKRFMAVVSRQGDTIHIESHQSSDGRDCVYNGKLTPDQSAITGECSWSGEHYTFRVELVASSHLVRHTASEGTYFLLAYQSVKTANGMTGFAPGTQVEQIEDHGEKVLVACQGFTIELPRYKLTNDVDLARALFTADANQQHASSVNATNANNAVAFEKIRQLQLEEAERQKRLAATSQRAARYVSPLQRGAYGQTNAFGSGSGSSGSSGSSSYASTASTGGSTTHISGSLADREYQDWKWKHENTLIQEIDQLQKNLPNLNKAGQAQEMKRWDGLRDEYLSLKNSD